MSIKKVKIKESDWMKERDTQKRRRHYSYYLSKEIIIF